MTSNVPEYLYHYTNIDSLALILKHRTIRLNSLDKMDDLQEQMSTDRQNFGKFVFVSSWTSDEDESIPMWRMYTPKGKGIRIKMPINPFVEYQPTIQELGTLLHCNVEGAPNVAVPFKMIVPAKDIFNGDFSIANYSVNNQLSEVKYVDDDELLRPTIIHPDGNGGISVDFGKLGIYKNTYWAFQKEWRYRLLFCPASTAKMIGDHLSKQNTEMQNLLHRFIAGSAALPFSHYDLHIRQECFNDMSITLSPDISDSAKMFAELLVEKYNPMCRIEASVLTNLIQ